MDNRVVIARERGSLRGLNGNGKETIKIQLKKRTLLLKTKKIKKDKLIPILVITIPKSAKYNLWYKAFYFFSQNLILT